MQLTWKKILAMACAIAASAAVYVALDGHCPEAARRTAFVFTLAAIFWAFEIIPLYATSLLVVLLEIFLLCKPGGVLQMDENGYTVFLVPFSSPVIILFFGGFMLAAALQKYRLDRWMAFHLLKFFGERPYFILTGFMAATAFLSMWMSNTATTAMMLAMIVPLLAQLDRDDRFKTALVLSIPFAANIGGMGTPVGTPPNAIALGILSHHGIQLNFLGWMRMAVPLVLLLLFFTSLVLIFLFPPKHQLLQFGLTEEKDIWGKDALLVAAIAILTVGLWLSSEWHHIPEALVALLAVGLFTTAGLIDRNDFKQIDWDILVLMWGGLALGKGMEISGLTRWMVEMPIFGYRGFVLAAVFCLLALFLSTFMSNTAAANLIVPIAISMPGESMVMLAVTVALSCSLAMALPISTPPNAMAFGTQAIKSRDMLISGLIISIVSVALILAGFKWILPVAFGTT